TQGFQVFGEQSCLALAPFAQADVRFGPVEDIRGRGLGVAYQQQSSFLQRLAPDAVCEKNENSIREGRTRGVVALWRMAASFRRLRSGEASRIASPPKQLEREARWRVVS